MTTRVFFQCRRPPCSVPACATFTAVLLLLSVVILYSHIAFDRKPEEQPRASLSHNDADVLLHDVMTDSSSDELDIIEENEGSPEDAILRGVETEKGVENGRSRTSGFYYDHVSGVIRRKIGRLPIDKWEDYVGFDSAGVAEEQRIGAFASDDSVVDEKIRMMIEKMNGAEDALLLKTDGGPNPLRKGWGHWFEKKGDFLRKDKMFRSSIELLNPTNNLLLQEPDSVGLTGLTRGDKLVQRYMIRELNETPLIG